jgi:predicted DNA-binding transcriptional regulator YafY
MRLRYQRFDGATGDYLLEPYHLVAYHGNWYVLALNTAAGHMEAFALSRCRWFARTGHHFTWPAAFDARAFFKDGFGITQEEKAWRVRLLFAKEVGSYIRERKWHRSQELRERPDGSLKLRLETSSRKELRRWIPSWMPHVKVLAQGQLRDPVQQWMRQGLARYG